jgi:hypothetical protein
VSPKPSATELELMRMLAHARSCDGVDCSKCRRIDLRLEDWPHAVEDPAARLERLDKALVATRELAERLYLALEGTSVAPGTRRVAAQLVQWLDRTREMLTLPLTAGDGVVPPPRSR